MSLIGVLALVGAVGAAGVSMLTGVTPCSLMSCGDTCPVSETESAQLVNVQARVRFGDHQTTGAIGRRDEVAVRADRGERQRIALPSCQDLNK